MKIASLYCSSCSSEVGLDHYGTMTEEGECPAPPMPIPGIMAILAHETGDEAHSGNQMTATRLCQCPRETAIQDNIESKAVNLEMFNAPVLWGQAMHQMLQRHTPSYMRTEVPVAGTLFAGTRYEIKVRGTADFVVPGVALLGDYKTHNLFTQQKLCKNPAAAHLEYDIQVSVYRMLLDIPVDSGAIWNGAMPARMSGVRPWLRVPVRFMDENEILAAKPFDGQRTVAEMLEMRKKFLMDWHTMTVEQAVNKIPLVGAEMAEWICSYCPVEQECSRLARIR